jgi:hypothetical protein
MYVYINSTKCIYIPTLLLIYTYTVCVYIYIYIYIAGFSFKLNGINEDTAKTKHVD